MSKPDIVPDQTVAGIAVDPQTLERVIPETRRPDGSIRRQIKIRPGFTPQEDVSRFRGSRQQQMDRSALPKGQILGWVMPSSDKRGGKKSGSMENTGPEKPLSKSAAKNAKRKAKKHSKQQKIIQENWLYSDEETPEKAVAAGKQGAADEIDGSQGSHKAAAIQETQEGASEVIESREVDTLAGELEKKLDVAVERAT